MLAMHLLKLIIVGIVGYETHIYIKNIKERSEYAL